MLSQDLQTLLESAIKFVGHVPQILNPVAELAAKIALKGVVQLVETTQLPKLLEI